jgi:hypothetical protein
MSKRAMVGLPPIHKSKLTLLMRLLNLNRLSSLQDRVLPKSPPSHLMTHASWTQPMYTSCFC